MSASKILKKPMKRAAVFPLEKQDGSVRKKKIISVRMCYSFIGDLEMSESFGCTDGCHHSNWTQNSFEDGVCCPQCLVTCCEDRGAAQQWKRVSGKSRGFL